MRHLMCMTIDPKLLIHSDSIMLPLSYSTQHARWQHSQALSTALGLGLGFTQGGRSQGGRSQGGKAPWSKTIKVPLSWSVHMDPTGNPQLHRPNRISQKTGFCRGNEGECRSEAGSITSRR